ncbi:hypothetical protein Ancab_032086 [Ancistrocladus abbreviatus]
MGQASIAADKKDASCRIDFEICLEEVTASIEKKDGTCDRSDIALTTDANVKMDVAYCADIGVHSAEIRAMMLEMSPVEPIPFGAKVPAISLA